MMIDGSRLTGQHFTGNDMFIEQKNIMKIEATMGNNVVILQDAISTLEEELGMVIQFFRAEGYSDKAIVEALKDAESEIEKVGRSYEKDI